MNHTSDLYQRYILNIPKGYSAVYVKDVEDETITYTYIFGDNFLNIYPIFNPGKSFGKLSPRDFQPCHLRC